MSQFVAPGDEDPKLEWPSGRQRPLDRRDGQRVPGAVAPALDDPAQAVSEENFRNRLEFLQLRTRALAAGLGAAAFAEIGRVNHPSLPAGLNAAFGAAAAGLRIKAAELLLAGWQRVIPRHLAEEGVKYHTLKHHPELPWDQWLESVDAAWQERLFRNLADPVSRSEFFPRPGFPYDLVERDGSGGDVADVIRQLVHEHHPGRNDAEVVSAVADAVLAGDWLVVDRSTPVDAMLLDALGYHLETLMSGGTDWELLLRVYRNANIAMDYWLDMSLWPEAVPKSLDRLPGVVVPAITGVEQRGPQIVGTGQPRETRQQAKLRVDALRAEQNEREARVAAEYARLAQMGRTAAVFELLGRQSGLHRDLRRDFRRAGKELREKVDLDVRTTLTDMFVDTAVWDIDLPWSRHRDHVIEFPIDLERAWLTHELTTALNVESAPSGVGQPTYRVGSIAFPHDAVATSDHTIRVAKHLKALLKEPRHRDKPSGQVVEAVQTAMLTGGVWAKKPMLPTRLTVNGGLSQQRKEGPREEPDPLTQARYDWGGRALAGNWKHALSRVPWKDAIRPLIETGLAKVAPRAAARTGLGDSGAALQKEGPARRRRSAATSLALTPGGRFGG